MAHGIWQEEMSMTQRLSTGMKILSACKKAFPQLDSSDVKLKAKSMEQTAFNEASSIGHYHELCQLFLSQIQLSQEPPKPDPADNDDGTYQNLGIFKAVYHKSGLFSTIFRAQDPKTSSIVALKLTTPSHMSPPHNSLREARLLSLATHSHVIALLSTFRQPGDQYILVFPFMNHTLEELLQSSVLTPRQILSHLHDLFTALAHIHSLGIIHRDIKPSNILLACPSGPAYLADFGIAWKTGDPDSEPADKKITDVGTSAYRPPELLFGYTSYDESLDLWAAGCVAAEALMGGKRTLFDAGALGSELALIHSIFKTLGTPTNKSWPEAINFPDWGKMIFHQFPAQPWTEILAGVGEGPRELVGGLVRYQSTNRLRASDVLNHAFLKSDDSIS